MGLTPPPGGRRRLRALRRELAKEVGPGHPLAGRRWRIVAQCRAGDDVLLVLADGRSALVHLTWSGRRERPPWPETVVSPDPGDPG